jgi:hypothetical protein
MNADGNADARRNIKKPWISMPGFFCRVFLRNYPRLSASIDT